MAWKQGNSADLYDQVTGVYQGKLGILGTQDYVPTFALDGSNNVTGLVGPGGARVANLMRDVRTQSGVWCDWQSNTGALSMVSANAGETCALDTGKLYNGVPALKCTWPTGSGTFQSRFTFTNAVSLKNFLTLQVPIFLTSNDAATANVASATAALQFWVYTTGGKQIRLQLQSKGHAPNTWATYSWNRDLTGLVTFGGGATSVADLDADTVAKVDIVQGTGAASASYPVWVGPLTKDALARPCVSIIMDGEYISQYTLIKPILDQYKLKASLALVGGNIGSSASFMTTAQIAEMYNQGHEPIHHTYSSAKTNGYVNATDWPNSAGIADDFNLTWAMFKVNGWLRGIGKAVIGYADTFTYGTADARQKLVQAGMRMAGVDVFASAAPTYAQQQQTLAALEYNNSPFTVQEAIQITSTHTSADVIAIIDRAIATGEWAIIKMHRAVTSAPGSLEMTTAEIQTWMAYLATKYSAGLVDVAPFGETYDKYFKRH